MTDFIMERTETFEIKTQTTTLRVVEGVCQVIDGISFVVMMAKPYHGLWCGEHSWINTPYTLVEVKRRATHLLKRLGEQCTEVEYHYDKYKELLSELERYTECVRQHRDEAMAYIEKNEGVTELQSKAFSFYLEGLEKEELYYYDKMIDEYQLPWISLRSLKEYIAVVENKYLRKE